jgi:2'-5' RNA ligase
MSTKQVIAQARAMALLAERAEAHYHALVLAALGRVADRFTSLIAAGKPVDPAETAALQAMWDDEIPELAEASARIYQTSGNAIARKWAPGSARARGSITTQMRAIYLESAAQRLTDVGDGLWTAATNSLAEGVAAGEDYLMLRDRLLAEFTREGTALGESKANLITRNEVSASVNGGGLDAMRQSDAAPQYKTWVATIADNTRPDHFEADGQVRPLDEPFEVGGELLDYPGDPSGSPAQTYNCRCVATYSDTPEVLTLDGRQFLSDEEIDTVVQQFAEQGVTRNPGLMAAAEPHTQGMIALIPSDEDAARIAVEGGEDPLDLHVTLQLLGEIEGMPEEIKAVLRQGVEDIAIAVDQFDGNAFAVSWFNPTGDDPCWVLGIGGDEIDAAHTLAEQLVAFLGDGTMWTAPEQHHPFVAHMTAKYTDDPELVEELATRVGPVRFDRIRLALAGDNYDVPLGGGTLAATEETAVTAAETGSKLAEGVAAGISRATPTVAAAATAAVQAAAAARLTASDTVTPPDVVFTTARLRGLTVVDIPAWIECGIRLTGPVDADGFVPWEAEAAMEGVPTGDGRLWEQDSFRWEARDDGYIGPLRWDEFDDGAHSGAVTIGTIDLAERRVNDKGETFIYTAGRIDTKIDHGNRVAQGIERGVYRGVSQDPDDIPLDSVIVEEPEMDDEIIVMEEAASTAAEPTLVADLAFPAGTSLSTAISQLAELMANGGTIAAAATGSDELPIADEGTDWDAAAAHDRQVEAGIDLGAGHLFRTPDADPADPGSWHLPFADIIDGELVAVPAGIDWASTAAVEMHDAGEIPDEEFSDITETLSDYYERLAGEDDDDSMMVDVELEASAWTAFRSLPALPAAAFAEPDLAASDEYLHYEDGRIFGWVAQAGVCHDGYTSMCVTAPLGEVDLANFNRQPVTLDDGTSVMAGAFTMNAGHDNDGAGVNSMRAQFDNTRTVAGIVTVGVKADGSGMWFSGVAAPWLSEWDTQVLAACRPSGHWKRTRGGGYSLRAVLSVPVPGFPNKVAASAAVERSNLALVASAAAAPPAEDERLQEWGADNAEALLASVAASPTTARLIAAAIVDEMEERAAIRAEVEELSASLNAERKAIAASMSV